MAQNATERKEIVMALTKAQVREILSAAGVASENMSEAVDKIIDGHVTSVNALREDIAKYKADAEKLPTVQKELDDMKANTNDSWKEKHDKLKGEFDTYKKDVEAKETHSKKVEAYRTILKDAGLSDKGIEKAVKYAEWDKIELEADGKLKGASDHIKAVKEEWAEYVTTTTTTGAKTSNPPANSGGAKLTKEDIYKKDERGRYVMSASERQKALVENQIT
jgi:hypothetical protein